MSQQHRCGHGNPNSDIDSEHNLALAGEIMCMVERHNTKKNTDPCPLCLRDTMLAVAALLHLDASRIASERVGEPIARVKQVSDALAKAAREVLESVAEAKAAIVSSHSRH
jgi:hypothetical protein